MRAMPQPAFVAAQHGSAIAETFSHMSFLVVDPCRPGVS
jgi:hypothetical protein